LSSPVVYYNTQRLAELAAKNRMPAISLYRVFPESGGLMSDGPSGHYMDLNRSIAAKVVKILGGTKPGDLPIERPTRDQPQDRQGARPDDLAVAAVAGG